MNYLLNPKERLERLAQYGHGQHGQRFEGETFDPFDSTEITLRRAPHTIHTTVDGFELVRHRDKTLSHQLIILGYNAGGELVEWKGACLNLDFGLENVRSNKSRAEQLGDETIREITS